VRGEEQIHTKYCAVLLTTLELSLMHTFFKSNNCLYFKTEQVRTELKMQQDPHIHIVLNYA